MTTNKRDMEHKQPRTAGKYVAAFSWHRHIAHFLTSIIREAPLLHVCAGPHSKFGDVRVDRFVHPIPPAAVAEWTSLPFRDDSFGAVFADPPWNIGYMKRSADFCKEALRIAPVVYVMSPWLWVNRCAKRSQIWIREFPGVNAPILIVRYEKRNAGQGRLALSATKGTEP